MFTLVYLSDFFVLGKTAGAMGSDYGSVYVDEYGIPHVGDTLQCTNTTDAEGHVSSWCT
jgi:hypothetical protein